MLELPFKLAFLVKLTLALLLLFIFSIPSTYFLKKTLGFFFYILSTRFL